MKKKRRAEKKEKLPEDGEATTESEQPPEPSIAHGDFLPVEGEESTPAEEEADDMAPIDYEFAKLELEEDGWDNYGSPSEKEIAEENRLMWRRHKEFRIAAEHVAAAFAELPEVQKVVLFGSVTLPLKKEVPRFRKFRRAGIAIWHECLDVDVAVWLTDLRDLKALQKARHVALDDLLHERDIGVAHHQVDVFIMEVGSDRYLGRLCCFNMCPKGKSECDVPGCGVTAFLRQHDKFSFDPTGLHPEKVVVLFDRGSTVDSSAAEGGIPF